MGNVVPFPSKEPPDGGSLVAALQERLQRALDLPNALCEADAGLTPEQRETLAYIIAHGFAAICTEAYDVADATKQATEYALSLVRVGWCMGRRYEQEAQLRRANPAPQSQTSAR